MGFWILALVGAFAILGILAWAMLKPRAEAGAATAAFDVQVYRDQLRELDRDVARGTLGEDEAGRARVEISRRLLEADRKLQAGEDGARAPKAATYSAIALVFALIIGGAIWLYTDLGAPGYWDMPLKGRIAAAEQAHDSRPSQAEAEAELPDWAGPPAEAPADYLELVAQLREAVARRPDDLQGHLLLASHETQLGNYRAAHAAMKRALEIKGDAATADDWSQYVDLLVLAANGYVSPEAEAAIDQALGQDAADPVARYYAGLMYAQVGRPDLAFEIWRALLESSSADDPWAGPIRAQILGLAQLAGVDYQLPGAGGMGMGVGPGPTAEDMAAAAEMTPEERAEMINGMVERLMDRLATEGGTAADWARLIQALGVQGNTERAAAIYAEAQTVFAASPEDLAQIDAAARSAGLDVTVPAAPAPGPSAEDVEAAAEMSDEDRMRMIDDMVTRLADRIGTEGGTPEEWVRLINAYGVMGEAEAAARAWENAQIAYQDDSAALATIRAAAIAAGVAE